jgi:hypothetical protein
MIKSPENRDGVWLHDLQTHQLAQKAERVPFGINAPDTLQSVTEPNL